MMLHPPNQPPTYLPTNPPCVLSLLTLIVFSTALYLPFCTLLSCPSQSYSILPTLFTTLALSISLPFPSSHLLHKTILSLSLPSAPLPSVPISCHPLVILPICPFLICPFTSSISRSFRLLLSPHSLFCPAYLHVTSVPTPFSLFNHLLPTSPSFTLNICPTTTVLFIYLRLFHWSSCLIVSPATIPSVSIHAAILSSPDWTIYSYDLSHFPSKIILSSLFSLSRRPLLPSAPLQLHRPPVPVCVSVSVCPGFDLSPAASTWSQPFVYSLTPAGGRWGGGGDEEGGRAGGGGLANDERG